MSFDLSEFIFGSFYARVGLIIILVLLVLQLQVKLGNLP